MQLQTHNAFGSSMCLAALCPCRYTVPCDVLIVVHIVVTHLLTALVSRRDLTWRHVRGGRRSWRPRRRSFRSWRQARQPSQVSWTQVTCNDPMLQPSYPWIFSNRFHGQCLICISQTDHVVSHLTMRASLRCKDFHVELL